MTYNTLLKRINLLYNYSYINLSILLTCIA